MAHKNAIGPSWLEHARSYLGQKEIKGPKHNPLILGWWKKINAAWFTDDETPWCGAFVGGVLAESGMKVAKNAASARAWLNYGHELKKPAVGCIVIFARNGGGHVGFVVGKDQKGNLMVLGGNQGDTVTIAPFAMSRVLGYRWPGVAPFDYRYDLPLVKSSGKVSTNEA